MKLWRSLVGKSYNTATQKIILGIDPGLARMGYGAIIQKGSHLKVLEYGTITSEAHMDAEKRLVVVFEKLRKVLEKVRPDEAAIEELFFARNVKTAISVGQARGTALLACGLAKVPVFEYKPMEIKQAVAGFGAADKGQIQKMVKLLLGLSEVPKPDDTADALAIAITHTQCSGTRLSEVVKKLSKSSVNKTFLKR